MAEQTERAFLKQPKVFLSSEKSGKGKRPGKGGNRFGKNVGLGFKTPKEAIQGTYINKKCPFIGTVSIRGHILAGTCYSAKMTRTIIVRRDYLHFVKKYQRYEMRHSNIPAHISPCFRVKEGDHVIIGQCRVLIEYLKCRVRYWIVELGFGLHKTERAFLKQPKVFLSSEKSGKGKRPGKGGNRFGKNVGLGFKTPKEAIQGTYIDKKCPFTGTVSIRGRILAGTCYSAKMTRTIIVRRDYLHFVKKYQRYETRHSNIPAHISPYFCVKEGDHVIIGQCRPLSKTVRFNVLKVIPTGSSSGSAKKAFTAI